MRCCKDAHIAQRTASSPLKQRPSVHNLGGDKAVCPALGGWRTPSGWRGCLRGRFFPLQVTSVEDYVIFLRQLLLAPRPALSEFISLLIVPRLDEPLFLRM